MGIIWNGIANGCLIAVFALAFGTVYLSTRVFHIALAAIISAAPFIAMTALSRGLTVSVSWGISVLSCALLSVACEFVSHWRLERRGASAGLQLVASLGHSLVIGQAVVLMWGNNVRTLRSVSDVTKTICGISLATSQWVAITGSLGAVLTLLLIYRQTKIGLLLRGIADNSTLIALAGYDLRFLRCAGFAVAGALAGLASLLMAFGRGFDSSSGISILLPAIAAVVLGGRTFIVGPVVAALLLGIVRSEITWYASSPWQDPVTFLILLLAMALPHGQLTIDQQL